MSPNITRRQLLAIAVVMWAVALALPLFTVPTPAVFDVVLLAIFGGVVWFTRESPKAPVFLAATVAVFALWALAHNSYPALTVAFDGAATLAAYEASVLLTAWPKSVPRLTLAGVEHVTAAALRVAIGILAALVVVLLGYVNLPAVTLMVVIGAIAAAVVLQLSTRR